MMEKRWFKGSEFAVAVVCAALVGAASACASTGAKAETDSPRKPATQEAALPAAISSADGKIQVQLSRATSPDGGLVVIRVKSDSEPTAKFEDIDLPFYPVDKGQYEALLGVPFNHQPGAVPVKVSAGKDSVDAPILIVDGGYKSEKLHVSPKIVNPSKRDVERIMREQKEVGAIYKQLTREKLWSGAFVLPVNSVMTSPFGTKRVFNGQMKSFHQGLDLRAKENTPITAPAGGIVVLAKDLFFTGNTVLLDHGYGLFTIYAHMNKLDVKVGDRVKTGQQLGLSGMTGRAAGPHLHWGVVVHHQKVNPLDMVERLTLTSAAGAAEVKPAMK